MKGQAKTARLRRCFRIGGWIGTVSVLALAASAVPGWCGSTSPSRDASIRPAHAAGCEHGSRRVGTRKDAALGRQWAVVVNCAHPDWPAHLEPAEAWHSLPAWVPAGTKIEVRAGSGHVVMNLSGKTVAPGHVGQAVMVQLLGGSRVAARLTGTQEATLIPRRHWGRS